MANTVSVLDFTNTFGDLLAQQNISAKELNNLGANNYTKDSGTLFLDGIGTGLSVTNTAALGAAIVSTTLAVSGDTTLLANVYLDAPGFTLQVANNAIIHKQIITDNITANTLVRTSTLNVTETAFANNVTSNNVVLTSTLNTTGSAFVNNLRANSAVTSPYIVATTRGIFEDITSNNQITTTFLNITTNVTSDLNVTTDINGRDFTGRAARFETFQTVGQLSVGGNFVINGTTVYSTNTFTLNAGSSVGQQSFFSVNRGSSGANASIRWNEEEEYFDIANVSSGNYFKILTADQLSDSTDLNSSSNVATSASLFNLQTQIRANNDTFSSNVSTLSSNISSVNVYSQTAFARANTSANVFTGTTGSSAIATNGRMSFGSNNGVIISATANTLFVNTPQDLTTVSNPSFNSIFQLGNPLSVENGGIGASDKITGLLNLLPSTVGVGNNSVLAVNQSTVYWKNYANDPLFISQGGTGATNAGQALTNLLPSSSIAGYVLTTGGPGSFYWAAPSGGGGGSSSIPGTTINSSRISYTANGTGRAYTTPTYVPGAAQLRIYIDGVRQFASGYTETSATVVTFATSPPSGSVVLVEVDGYAVTPFQANTTLFTINSNISSTANNVQTAIDTLTSLVAFKSGTTFTGLLQAPTPSTGTSNTQVATTAFVNNLINSGATFNNNISGNAGTVTGGVYTSGNQTIGGTKTFSSTISGSITSATNATNLVGGNMACSGGSITSSAPTLSFIDTDQADFSIHVNSNVWYVLNQGGSGIVYTDQSGNFTAVGSITSFSDERLKTNWRPVQDNFVEKLANIKSGVYDRTDMENTQVGVSAQSLQTLIPEAVRTDKDGMLSVNYGASAMVSAIELAKEIALLRAEIAELKYKGNIK
jgi:hypothetical protein